MQRPRVPVVGLIGGVGSGKSSLAEWISGRLPVCVINADEAGHRALARGDVRKRIRDRFGEEVFDNQGNIRRDRLAARVFGADEGSRADRRELENIVHPIIREDLRGQVDAARSRTDVDVVLLDAAVLLEAGWKTLCDAVVFIDTSLQQRQSRIGATRGWSAEQLRSREDSQLGLEEKRAAGDLIVDNSGSIDLAGAQLLDWIKQSLIENS